MLKHKSIYNQNQFIPKTGEQSKGHLEPKGIGAKSNTKLSYDEIRQIVEKKNEKEISRIHTESKIKNKFNIV